MNVKNSAISVPAIQRNSEMTRDSVQQKQTNRQAENKNSNDLEVTREKTKSTVEKLNDFVDPLQTHLKFVYHDDLNEYYVTVINPLTDEVIREIPPKKMLDMYAAMTQYMGLLVDEKI